MEGLTKEQEQEYNRDKAVQSTLAENQTLVDSYPPMQSAQTTLTDQLEALELKVQGKLPVTSCITTAKKQDKQAVATEYGRICGICRAFCITTGNTELADQFKWTEDKIKRLPDGDVFPVCESINTLINDQLLALPAFGAYGITATVLSAALLLATNFKNQIGKADSVDSSKTAAGTSVAEQIDDLRSTIEVLLLLNNHFKTTQPRFYESLIESARIDDIGVHHSGIQGEITVAGVPHKNGKVKCVQLNKETTTDLLGHYDLIRMKPGTYEFTATLSDGITTQTKVIKVKRGKIIEVDWDF